MQVILQEDYPSLGFVGDLINVKGGFARNFLFPKKIAMPANDENISLLEHRKRVLDIKREANKKIAEQYRDKIEGVEIKVTHACGEGGKLFGSVTLTEIHENLAKSDVQVDRKLIRLEAPIKTVGVHEVEIKLHQEVFAKFKVVVEGKEEKNVEKKAEKKAPKKREAKADEKTDADKKTGEVEEKKAEAAAEKKTEETTAE